MKRLPGGIAKFADLLNRTGEDDDIMIVVVRAPNPEYTTFHVPCTMTEDNQGAEFAHLNGETVPVQSIFDRVDGVVRHSISPYALRLADTLFAYDNMSREPDGLGYGIKVYPEHLIVRKRMTCTDEKFERDVLRILADFLQLDTSKIVVHIYDNRRKPQVTSRPI